MKFSELANQLATDVQETMQRPLGDAAIVTAVPMLTDKDMAAYGRMLEPGNIAIRFLIVVDEAAGELGKMELFIPVSKRHLKEFYDAVFASVMRYIKQATEYRAAMIGRVRERVAGRETAV